MDTVQQRLNDGTATETEAAEQTQKVGVMLATAERIAHRNAEASRQMLGWAAALGESIGEWCESNGRMSAARKIYVRCARAAGDAQCAMKAADLCWSPGIRDLRLFEEMVELTAGTNDFPGNTPEVVRKLRRVTKYCAGCFFARIVVDPTRTYTEAEMGGKDLTRARHHFYGAVELGHIDAACKIMALASAEGGAAEIRELCKLFDLGVRQAMHVLGKKYAFGDGVPQDIKRAEKLFKRGIRKSSPYCLWSLQNLYIHEAQHMRWRKFLLNLVKGEHDPEFKMMVAGGIFPAGTPESERSAPRPFLTLECTVTKGTPGVLVPVKAWAAFQLSFVGDLAPAKRRKFLKRAADAGVPAAVCNNALEMTDFKEAHRLLSKAAKLGIADAAAELGLRFFTGRRGFPVDKARAAAHFAEYRRMTGGKTSEAEKDCAAQQESVATGRLPPKKNQRPREELKAGTSLVDASLEMLDVKAALRTLTRGHMLSAMQRTTVAEATIAAASALSREAAANLKNVSLLLAEGSLPIDPQRDSPGGYFFRCSRAPFALRSFAKSPHGDAANTSKADALFGEAMLLWESGVQAAASLSSVDGNTIPPNDAIVAVRRMAAAVVIDPRACTMAPGHWARTSHNVLALEPLLSFAGRVLGLPPPNPITGRILEAAAGGFGFGGQPSLCGERLFRHAGNLTDEDTARFACARVGLHLRLLTQSDDYCLRLTALLKAEVQDHAARLTPSLLANGSVLPCCELWRHLADLQYLESALLHRKSRKLSRLMAAELELLLGPHSPAGAGATASERNKWAGFQQRAERAAVSSIATCELALKGDLVAGLVDRLPPGTLRALIGSHPNPTPVPKSLAPGTDVRICGLRVASELNNARATVVRYVPDRGRFECHIHTTDASEPKAQLVRPRNLRRLNDDGRRGDAAATFAGAASAAASPAGDGESLRAHARAVLMAADVLTVHEHFRDLQSFLTERIPVQTSAVLLWRPVYVQLCCLLDKFICIRPGSYAPFLWEREPKHAVFGEPGLDALVLKKIADDIILGGHRGAAAPGEPTAIEAMLRYGEFAQRARIMNLSSVRRMNADLRSLEEACNRGVWGPRSGLAVVFALNLSNVLRDSKHLPGNHTAGLLFFPEKAPAWQARLLGRDVGIAAQEAGKKRQEIRAPQVVRTNCCGCGQSISLKEAKRCGRCRVAHYCSAACQKHAWKAHKKECKRLLKKRQRQRQKNSQYM